MKRTTVIAAAAVAALGLAGMSLGAWVTAGAGAGAARAKVMPAGSVPSATVSSHDVTLSWTASQFAGGSPVSGYLVKRYDGVTSVLQSISTACNGTVSAVTCVEHSVPTGTWKYTITPTAGNNWVGPESALSSLVIVLI